MTVMMYLTVMNFISKKRSYLMPAIVEAQAYRCAVCTGELRLDVGYEQPEWPSLVKYDRALNRNYLNSVALCRTCACRQGNSPSLEAFYLSYINGDLDNREVKVQPPIDEMVLDAIRAEIAVQGGDPEIVVPTPYGKAPIESAAKIARWLIVKSHGPTRADRKEKKKIAKAKWMSRGQRRRFMETQNHRCIYCAHDLEADQLLHPRYGTWEHVEALKNGGFSKMQNLVIACRVCNSLRDIKGMSAYEYAEWAPLHLDEIEAAAKRMLRATEIKTRVKGPEWLARLNNRPSDRKLFG